MKKLSISILALLVCMLQPTAAIADAAPPVDPEVQRLTAETARLTARTAQITAEAALATARFGAAPTAPAGAITNPEKFAAMGQWTLSAATRNVAQAIAERAGSVFTNTDVNWCEDTGILVTSTEDRRSAAWIAEVMRKKLQSLSKLLNQMAKPADRTDRMAPMAAIGAFRGAIGTLDSLVGLFRTDYTFSDLAATTSDLSLRMEVSRKLAEISVCHHADGCDSGGAIDLVAFNRINIDGVGGPTTIALRPANGLLVDYEAFDSARLKASQKYASDLALAKTDQEKARLAAVKVVIDAAAAFDTALTTPAAGLVPLVSMSLAAEQSGYGQCVVMVKFSSYADSLVTRKRLLSRNDSVVAIAGGIVQTAFFDSTGRLLDAGTFRLDQRIGGRLSDVIKGSISLDASQSD